VTSSAPPQWPRVARERLGRAWSDLGGARAGMIGMIVLGYDEPVVELCRGGFELQVTFSRHPVRELAKMDGASCWTGPDPCTICGPPSSVPDPALPPASPAPGTGPPGAGSRGRPASRDSVSKSSGSSRSTRGARYVLDDTTDHPVATTTRLATMERVQACGGQVTGALSALEIEGPGDRPRPWRPPAQRGEARWSAGSPTRSRATWARWHDGR